MVQTPGGMEKVFLPPERMKRKPPGERQPRQGQRKGVSASGMARHICEKCIYPTWEQRTTKRGAAERGMRREGFIERDSERGMQKKGCI